MVLLFGWYSEQGWDFVGFISASSPDGVPFALFSFDFVLFWWVACF